MDEDVWGLYKSVRSHIDTYVCRCSSLKWCLIVPFARIMATVLKDARYPETDPTIPVDEENERLKRDTIGVSVNLAFKGYCPPLLGYDREHILEEPRGGPAEARTEGDVIFPCVRRRVPISGILLYFVTCQTISAFLGSHGNLMTLRRFNWFIPLAISCRVSNTQSDMEPDRCRLQNVPRASRKSAPDVLPSRGKNAQQLARDK